MRAGGHKLYWCRECLAEDSRQRYQARRAQAPEPGTEVADLRYEPTEEGWQAAPGELRYEITDLGRAALAVHAGDGNSLPPPASTMPMTPLKRPRGRRALALLSTGWLLEGRAATLEKACRGKDLATVRAAGRDVVDMARIMVLLAGGAA
ncbi:MAG: hypothetical protein HY794_13455 [Desulfarculus sp.]|nr:hypothetical protein [Desulfarculus sp.]